LKLMANGLASLIDTSGTKYYTLGYWRRSSVVEQGTHKPLVTSSNLVAATFCFPGDCRLAYNVDLELRIDSLASLFPKLGKRRMFGGICYLLNGNMCAGIYREYLIVRTSEEIARGLLKSKDVKPFDITGKAMKGWVMVSPDYVETNDELFSLVKLGIDFAESLPRK
jgi:TfoX/Sxy family transcriptional regulator of competence genes